MKSRLRVIAVALMVVVANWMIVGCKTTPKWDERIGNYTYDQALAELGPPDKTAKLSDGKTVAEWVTGHGPALSFGVGTGVYGGHSSVGVGQSIGTTPGVRVLRLIFGTDNNLVSWSKN